MPDERFREVRELFEAALENCPKDPLAWLRDTVVSDDDVRQQVEGLLRADQLADHGFTLTPDVLSSLSSVAADLPSFEGRRVGQYDLLREIGRGGSGSVYLAQRADNVFSKHVAFKILRPEQSGPELLRRFRQEREIVARLEHPNIARLLDGGTTDEGLPYFVMEYVDGQPLDVFCDERRLDIRDRLALLRTVCGAVQYAHQNLIVHRDLKPSNILVTSDGTVKLLDFGIAKLLGADAEDTFSPLSAGARLLTLAYASPEQINGELITTSSDVYSLGVVLYELLTGRRPYATKDVPVHHLAQTICEQRPEPPSEIVRQVSGASAGSAPQPSSAVHDGSPAKLARRLSGELDNIVMMALRKEPERRYGSVEQFSEDLRRYLSGLPVLAQTDTLVYRTRKFIGRHGAAVAAAVLVLALMTAAVAATSWQARVARDERARAEHQAAEARFQSHRAESQAREADRYRVAAEREAAFARQQLRIVRERTQEADASRREADAERARAERRTRDVRAIAAALLDMNANIPEIPDSLEAGRRAAADAERILVGLGSDGVADPSLASEVAAVRGLVTQLDAIEAGITRSIPAGWVFNSRHQQDYEAGLDRRNAIGGAGAYIKSRHSKARGSAALFQVIDAEPHRGKRLRVSAMLKSTGVADAAGILVDVAADDGALMLDTNRQLTLRGTKGWSRQAIVFEVPDSGSEITIGFALKGSGAVWADDFSFDVVDSGVPITAGLLQRPTSPSFEDAK